MANESLEQSFLQRVKTNDTLMAQVVTSSGTGTLDDPATSMRIVGGSDDPDTGGQTPQQPTAGGDDGEGAQAPKKPARFTITDPRINGGQPTGFDRIEDAVAIAGADQPLEKIEESIESQFVATLQTAQQKDAYQNLVDLVNIPAEHIAGLISKGSLKETADPLELGETLLSGFDLDQMDDERRAVIATAVGVVGMALIDPMNAIAGAGKAAKAAKTAAGKVADKAAGARLEPVDPDQIEWFMQMMKGDEIPQGEVRISKTSSNVKTPGGGVKTASIGDQVVARAEVREFNGEPILSKIETLPGARRRGIATALINDLKKEYPGKTLQWTMTTEKGAALRKSIEAQDAKSAKPMSLEQAIKILKDERGSIPLSFGGGGGKKPPAQGSKRAGNSGEEERIWESVRGTFEGFAESVTKQRRGPVLHDVELIKLEKDTDLTLNAALSLPPGSALPPEKLLRVRNMLKRQFNAMKKAQKKYAESDDIKDFRTMLTAMGHTNGLLRVLLGLYAEPARDVRIMAGHLPSGGAVKAEASDQFLGSPDAFAQFKEREFRIADEWINQLYDFFVQLEQASKRPNMPGPAALRGSVMKDMGEAVDMLKSEEELAVFLKPLHNPVFWDVWQEQFYNAMLVGLAPIKNFVGTPAIAAMEIAQRGVMAGIDSIGTGLVRTLINPDAKRSVYFGEVSAMLDMAANLEAFQAGVRVAWESFKQGKPLVDVSHAEHTFPEISDTTLWLYTTGPMNLATSWMSNSARRWINKGIDFGSTVGGRMLLSGDTFNKFMAHQAQLRALALREAYQRVEAEGLEGVEAVMRTQEIKLDVLANSERYPELHDKARQFAQYVALQQELGKAGELMRGTAKGLTVGPREAGFPSGFPVGTYMMPFTTIVFNAAKMAGEHSGPLQLASPAVWAELKAGGDRQLAAMAKIAFSTVMLDQFYNMAREGLITGNGPKDRKAKQAWMEATGKVPNAWWDPISKQYRSCTAFEPFCTVTSAVADLNDMMSYTPPDQVGQIKHAFEALALAIVNNAGIKQWTQGLAGTMNTALSGDYASYEEWFAKAIGTAVPYSGAMRQVTPGVDQYMRSATGIIDNLKKNIPGLSDQLPVERNALGKVLYRRGGWWNAFSHGLESQDPDIWKALMAHDIVIGMPSKEIAPGVTLDPWQYDAYIQAVTDGLDEDLREQFVSESENLTPAEATKRVRQIVENHRRTGKAAFLAEFEDVGDKIEGQKERVLEGERVRPSRYAPGKVEKELFIAP